MKKVLLLFVVTLISIADTFIMKVIDCNDGNAEACLEAGKIYSVEGYKEKKYTQKEIASKVADYYKKACKLGSAKGCTEYAKNYYADKNKDTKKTQRYYFQLACQKGDNIACTMLVMMPDK